LEDIVKIKPNKNEIKKTKSIMDNRLIITKPDNFVLVDLELFAWDGIAEELMDTVYDIRRAIERGERIVLEGGNIPAKREVKWTSVDKVLINGHWYGKYADILRG
jgi:hypothetical protein